MQHAEKFVDNGALHVITFTSVIPSFHRTHWQQLFSTMGLYGNKYKEEPVRFRL